MSLFGPDVRQRELSLSLHPRENDRFQRGDFQLPRRGELRTWEEARNGYFWEIEQTGFKAVR